MPSDRLDVVLGRLKSSDGNRRSALVSVYAIPVAEDGGLSASLAIQLRPATATTLLCLSITSRGVAIETNPLTVRPWRSCRKAARRDLTRIKPRSAEREYHAFAKSMRHTSVGRFRFRAALVSFNLSRATIVAAYFHDLSRFATKP